MADQISSARLAASTCRVVASASRSARAASAVARMDRLSAPRPPLLFHPPGLGLAPPAGLAPPGPGLVWTPPLPPSALARHRLAGLPSRARPASFENRRLRPHQGGGDRPHRLSPRYHRHRTD